MQPSSAIPFPKLPSEIYTQIGDTARRFAETRVRPAAQDLDETERFPAEIYAEMAELGLFGITVPEEFGGAGRLTRYPTPWSWRNSRAAMPLSPTSAASSS